jgi:hypothetical protein
MHSYQLLYLDNFTPQGLAMLGVEVVPGFQHILQSLSSEQVFSTWVKWTNIQVLWSKDERAGVSLLPVLLGGGGGVITNIAFNATNN